MISTTGTTIKAYLEWVKDEVEKKKFGEISIKFIVHEGTITRVIKEVQDSEIPGMKK